MNALLASARAVHFAATLWLFGVNGLNDEIVQMLRQTLPLER